MAGQSLVPKLGHLLKSGWSVELEPWMEDVGVDRNKDMW